jgi:ubiquinone biosynthesis protein
LEEARIYGFPDLVRLARKTLEGELDFRREARHMKIARTNMKNTPGVYVPEPFDQYCTSDLLVMEFIEGKKLKEMDPPELENPEIMARHGLQATIQQVLEDGFFHADPHMGNLLIAKDMTLCLLDWGMVGRLTEDDRFELIDMVNAVVARDSRKLVDCLLTLTRARPDLSRRELERSLLDIIDAYLSVPVGEIRIGRFVADITDLMHEYRLRLPPDMFMLTKAIMTSEATASILFPDLNVIAEAEPLIRRIVLKRYRPDVLLARFTGMVFRLLSLRGKLPVRMARIVEKIEKGQLHIRFEHENLEGLRHTLEHTFNRLTFGVIIGAMIIGSSMVITTGVRPYLFGYPALGILGYLISAVLGLWLIVSIIRTRRY